MMYADVNDLTMRLGEQTMIQLTNPNSRADSIDNSLALASIHDAMGIIDSYIGQRVNLPLENVPALVKTLTIDLAIYYLKVKVGNTNTKDSAVSKLYDDAIKHLERFADGKTSLGLHVIDDNADSEQAETETNNHADISSEKRAFTRSSLGKLT